MSLSNPQAKNPAARFMQWRGGVDGGGRITYYDKEAKEEIEMALPLGFTVLDELSTITGYSKKDQSGFWSNEVRDLMNDALAVKTKSGTIANGKYAEIKESIVSKGAKYAKSVYVAFKDEQGELQIGNLKISGAALTAWIEFQKRYDVGKVGVLVTDTPKAEKNGSNDYFVPEFKALELSKATLEAAKQLDRQLQSYLDTYLTRKPSADDGGIEEEDDDVEIEETDVVIDAPKTSSKPAVAKKTATKEDDEKIDIADIPF